MTTHRPCRQVELQFEPKLNELGKNKRLANGLSAVVQIEDTLWLAHDETATLERLTLSETTPSNLVLTADHRRFSLHEFLTLPVPSETDHSPQQEVDIEGLAYADGYIWLVGSHSLKRKKPKSDQDVESNQNRLASVIREGNRFLVARIPVEAHKGCYRLCKTHKKHTAACLQGDENGNELTTALASDPHLSAFLNIPGKDNGFDIEGLAVVNKRLFLGLRGPVLRGWAIILEIELDEQGRHLQAIGPDKQLYRKHFLQLGGLGVRDLCFQNSDLLILAGPSMVLDGPVTVFRWRNAARIQQESFLSSEQLQPVLKLPYGEGNDHPEGMSLFCTKQAGPSLIIVNDTASPQRQTSPNTLLADVFELP
ncbi:DUF3616 domain-containing protein [Methylomonas methanica]|uniref:DUF3616 domain-containing protein n=1 Tax=Methylomonas methanica (strain DSM 25384 / MC09) TaxID=857087 RepID=G0A3I8_METMM|nr:DUF3616 domain-containing protein [Methylomonas methanica]AEG00287.1 hypothetical protein Metme_1871 [Methylomonas methanica MC09]